MDQKSSGKCIMCPFCGMSFVEGGEPLKKEVDRLCMVCGHSWRSRGGYIPRRCPSCRSTEWNVSTRSEVFCCKCGHRWVPRGGRVPSMCPKCKTYSWRGSDEVKDDTAEERLQCAVSMYSEGMGCIDASLAAGVSLEALILRITSIRDGPVRMVSAAGSVR